MAPEFIVRLPWGNRTWMDDAPGRVDYVYDQLSQLKEETRLFDVGGTSRSFNLKYEYNLAGQLKQITDPWNAVVTYNRDKAGQENGMAGTGYKDVNQWTNRDVNTFASNIKYRAWGGIKQFTGGTLSGNNSFAMGYDSRLRLTSFTGGNRTTQHTYYNDGLVKDVTDLYYGSNFLRKYEYDHASQLKMAHAGGTAQTSSSPYSLTYNYDAWGRMTSRGGSNWSNALTTYSTTFTNDRDANMTFDAAGNVKGYSTNYNDPYMHYNAASQLFTQLESGVSGLVYVRENYSDGDGAKVYYKRSIGSLINGSYTQDCSYYLIRSSALGGKVIAEFKDLTLLAANDPLKYYSKSYLYLKGVQLGFQENAHKTTGDKHVTWSYHNPTVGSYFAEYQLNNSSGQQVNYPAGEMAFDPLGSYVGISQPPQPPDVAPFTFVSGQAMDPSGKCYADYVETRCEVVQKMLSNGSGAYAPSDSYTTGPNNRLESFTVDWDNGFYGFVPVGARRSQSGKAWYDPYTQTEGSLRNSFIGAGFGLTGGQQDRSVALPPAFKPLPLPPLIRPLPIYCQPDVIEAMKRAWARTSNGLSGNEAGFVLNGTPHKYSIVDTKSAMTKNEQKMEVYADTFLLFHVHPNHGGRYPSTPENNAKGRKDAGDTLVADTFQNRQPPRTILFLVGHREGLTMYDPRTPNQFTDLRKSLEWTEPCK